MTDVLDVAAVSRVAGGDRPLLKPWLTWTTTDDSLVVSSGSAVTVFQGAAARLLLPSILARLDGTLTVDEIVAAIGEAARPAIEHAIAEVASRDLLVNPSTEDEERRGDWAIAAPAAAIAADRMDATPHEVASRLRTCRVQVAGDGPLVAEVVRQLRLFGVGEVTAVRTPSSGEHVDLVVVAVGPGGESVAASWNREAMLNGQAWLPVMAYDGRLASVGPLIVPGQTACFECLRIRRASNLSFRVEQRLVDDARDQDPAASRGGMIGGPMLHMCAALAADAATGMLLAEPGEPSILAGRVVTAAPSMGGPQVETHRLYRVPRCPACSRAAGLGHAQVWFEPEPDHSDHTSEDQHVCSSCGG